MEPAIGKGKSSESQKGETPDCGRRKRENERQQLRLKELFEIGTTRELSTN